MHLHRERIRPSNHETRTDRSDVAAVAIPGGEKASSVPIAALTLRDRNRGAPTQRHVKPTDGTPVRRTAHASGGSGSDHDGKDTPGDESG